MPASLTDMVGPRLFAFFDPTPECCFAAPETRNPCLNLDEELSLSCVQVSIKLESRCSVELHYFATGYHNIWQVLVDWATRS